MQNTEVSSMKCGYCQRSCANQSFTHIVYQNVNNKAKKATTNTTLLK